MYQCSIFEHFDYIDGWKASSIAKDNIVNIPSILWIALVSNQGSYRIEDFFYVVHLVLTMQEWVLSGVQERAATCYQKTVLRYMGLVYTCLYQQCNQ